MSQKPEKPLQKAGQRWPVPLAGLYGIRLSDLPGEISAGITLAALMIPLNIGYAQVAGLPPVTGLYAAIIPLVLFALLTSSRHVVTSPDASIAALLGAALLPFAAPGDPLRLQYGLALAIMCGVVFFIFWAFRLAFLANFLSRAVLVGFITGLGIEVFTNQVRKILGASVENMSQLGTFALQIKDAMASSVETEGYFVELLALLESIPHANVFSVSIGVGAIVIIRLLRRYAPKVPGALVALVVLTLIVAMFNLDERGVSVLGKLSSGLPSFTVPELPLREWLRLLPGAMAIVAITLCEGLLLVRRYSQKYQYKADGNQVLFAYGVANMAAGLSGSIVTGNSPSRTAAMEAAGSRSQLPSLVAAGVVALIMLFFTDVLAYLPQAALAGIVANAVLSLIEIGELRELWRMRRSEFLIAVVCLVCVLALGPLRAVMIAFLLSTIDVIRRAANPGTWLLQESPDGSHFVPVQPGHDANESGLVIYRFGAPLYFANAKLFGEQIEDVIRESSMPVKWLVLDAEAIVDMDTTGADSLRQILSFCNDRDVEFAISRANDSLLHLLDQYELSESVGHQRRFPTNRHAIVAFRKETASDGDSAERNNHEPE